MEISLNDEQLDSALRAAILTTITGDKRDEIFARALAALIDEEVEVGHGYTKKKVKRIDLAFGRAIDFAASKTARELLETEPYASKIKEAIKRGIDHVFETQMEKISEEVGNAIAQAIFKGVAREY